MSRLSPLRRSPRTSPGGRFTAQAKVCLLAWLLLARLLAAPRAQAAEPSIGLPPADHPLYQMPAYRADQSALLGRPLAGLPREETPQHGLKWTLELPRPAVHVGEVLWGRLTLSNRCRLIGVRLSPPANGEFVSTLGLWVSQGRRDVRGRMLWSEPREIYWANKGPFDARLCYRGMPVTIAARASRSFWIPINVARPPILASTIPGLSYYSAWLPGAGMHEPGCYRFYLKYVNQEELSVEGTSAPRRTRDQRPVEDYPAEPVVLGPYEVEIRPLTRWQRGPVAEDARQLQSIMADWGEAHSCPPSCKYTNHPGADLSCLPGILRRLDRSDLRVRWSMEYMMLAQSYWNDYDIDCDFAVGPGEDPVQFAERFRVRGMSTPALPEYDAAEGRRKIDRWWQALLDAVGDEDPLQPTIQLSYALRLYAQGRHDAAAQLAQTIATPDAEAFLAALARAREQSR